MNRGMVFWKDGKLVLLKDNLEAGTISDYDELYKDLGDNRAEIVEVDMNDITGLVGLKGVYCMSFYKYENEICSADEAITYALKNDPGVLIKRMMDNEE